MEHGKMDIELEYEKYHVLMYPSDSKSKIHFLKWVQK